MNDDKKHLITYADLASVFAAMSMPLVPITEPKPHKGKIEHHHPTRASHEESKTRRKMAAKSRKINRGKK